MSKEEKDVIMESNDKSTSMYVHQVEYNTLLEILGKVTDVNKVFTYSMPNKAESYASSGFELINVLNEYIDGQDDWRITKETNVKLKVQGDTIMLSKCLIKGTKLVMCIPRINSIILIPDENSTINGVKDPTKIIQLTNCISVTPLLVRLLDDKVEGEDEKFQLGLTYEIIIPKEKNEPTE